MARELALQALYGIADRHREPGDVLTEMVGRRRRHRRPGVRQGPRLRHARVRRRDRPLDGAAARGWTIERLPTIDRMLLRMGAFELRHRPRRRRGGDQRGGRAGQEILDRRFGPVRQRRLMLSRAKRRKRKRAGRPANELAARRADRHPVDACCSAPARSPVSSRRTRATCPTSAAWPTTSRALDARLRARRLAARVGLQRKPHLGADRADPGAGAQRVHRQRRSPFLPASRRRLRRHPARRRSPTGARRIPRRLDDHAATRAAAVPQRRSLDLAQGAGSAARDRDRALLHEGRNPRALSQHHLLGVGRLRRPSRRAHLFRHDVDSHQRSARPRCWPACSPRRRTTRRSSTLRSRTTASATCSTAWSRAVSSRRSKQTRPHNARWV